MATAKGLGDEDALVTIDFPRAEDDEEAVVMTDPKPAKSFSLTKMMSLRRSFISSELENTDVKFSRRTSEIVAELSKLDKDGDGEIDAVEIASYMDRRLQQKSKMRYWKLTTLLAFLLFVVTLGVNMALT